MKLSFLSFFVILMMQQGIAQNKISEPLLTAPAADCWVLLSSQAEVEPPTHYTKNEKTRYVFDKLQSHAKQSQSAIQQFLLSQNISHQPYWIFNGIYIPNASQALMQELARRGDVARILPNTAIRNAQAERAEVLPALRDATPEWGISKVQADKLWALGINGQGAVIGGQDTGYDWMHPALKSSYRGWDGTTANHNYHWHDAIHGKHALNPDSLNPCGFDVNQPCDDGSHGTHTMGTMAGSTPDDAIGLAPAARWIGCRNMERGWGTPETYIECFQWFLAPTDLQGQNPDPNQAPDVINNSWGCPEVEGCHPDNFETMRLAVANLRHAGVVVVVSAGNDGPACNTVQNPAAIFGESFSVGASNPADTMANFSSRGLVKADGSLEMKPNVSAPGTQVRSSVPNGGYAYYNGTSMAGPHVAGAVALLIAAEPALAGQVERIEEILEQTAVPVMSGQTCDGIAPDAIPNPISGYGRIDVWEALRLLRPELVSDAPLDTNKLRVYPNPTNGSITLITPEDMDEAVLSVYTPIGALMYRKTLSFKRITQIDLSSLPNGMYMVNVQSTELRKRRFTAKVVKGF